MSRQEGRIEVERKVSVGAEPGTRRHVVELDECGPVVVLVQGSLDTHREAGLVCLTVHHVGADNTGWQALVSLPAMTDFRRKAAFLHVCLPGQEPGAADLPAGLRFPTMAELGLQLVTVLDHLRVDRVVGLGDGAGANIITRFAMNHPSRVHGVMTINNTATTSLGRFMERLQVKNTNTQKEKSLNKK